MTLSLTMASKLNQPEAPSILTVEFISLKHKPDPKSNPVYNNSTCPLSECLITLGELSYSLGREKCHGVIFISFLLQVNISYPNYSRANVDTSWG